MSATNSTPIINLPLFIGTDKPAWLTDWNGAMNTIDTAIANLQTAESGTATSLASLAQSVEALSGTVSQHTTAIQTVTNATAGNTGSINTINSLIGKGEPTTEDKTIIGAINEIYSEIGGGTGVAAEDVTYSNTTSGLTATNVQAAIDEVIDEINNIPTGTSIIASVNCDGVKTYSELFNELFALVEDKTFINLQNTMLEFSGARESLQFENLSASNELVYTTSRVANSNDSITIESAYLSNSNSKLNYATIIATGTTFQDFNTIAPPSGTISIIKMH